MTWKNDLNKRALAIVRRSSKGQEENSSADTQDREIRNYAVTNGLEIVRLESIIETAFKPEDRKKYNQLMDFALKEGIKHVIFYLSSRETRNLSDAERNEHLVKDGKLIIHHVSDSKVFSKYTPDSDWLNREIHSVLNKNYSRENSSRVKAAYLTRLEQGHWPYRHTPLGYIHSKDKDKFGNPIKGTSRIVVDPDISRVKLVLREFALRAEGYSYDQIREIVLREGLVPSDIRSTYHRTSIEKRLKNEFYWGQMRFLGKGDEAEKVYQGNHPLIVPEAILRKVEAVRKGKIRKNRKTKLPSDDGGYFRGLINCGHPECQRLVTYERHQKTYKSTPGEKAVYHLYRCGNSRKVHQSTGYINENKIWEVVDSVIKDFAITQEFAEEIAKALNETNRTQQKAAKKQIDSITASITVVHSNRRNMTSLFAQAKISERDYNDQIAVLGLQEIDYNSQLEQLNLLINPEAMISAQKIFELAKHAKSLWQSMDKQKRLETFKYAYSNATLTDFGKENGLKLEIKLHPAFERLTNWNSMKENEDWRRESSFPIRRSNTSNSQDSHEVFCLACSKR